LLSLDPQNDRPACNPYSFRPSYACFIGEQAPDKSAHHFCLFCPEGNLNVGIVGCGGGNAILGGSVDIFFGGVCGTQRPL
jgi:hypothetical protein